MTMKRILLVLCVPFVLLSCGKEKEADKIGDAQFCLDNLDEPTPAEANECAAMVDGLDSPGAYGIRCSAAFIREGIVTGDRLVAAMKAIKTGTSGSNLQKMMGLLTFTSEGAIAGDFENTDLAFHACLASGGKGSTLLSSFGYFTMSLLNFFNAKGACLVAPVTQTGYTYYDLEGCVTAPDNLISFASAMVQLGNSSTPDAAAQGVQAGIGSVLIATYKLSCSTSQANKDLCKTLKASIDEAGGEANPREVAVKFISKIVQ